MSDDDDLERFTPVRTSDVVALRPSWHARDEDRRRQYVWATCAAACALFAVVVSALLGRVASGIGALTTATARSAELSSRPVEVEYKIVSWCSCGRTLRAGALGTNQGRGVPLEDSTCNGCFYNYAYAAGKNQVEGTFPKTDYDTAEVTHSERSFIHQMKKHNISDSVIVDKCGWRTEGTAYYAYGQEEIDVRMCVVEEFINHMATQGWFFTIETWYATSKDMVIFKKYT